MYLRINNPYLASYGVEDPEFAIVQLAQTTMRSEIGKISLDKVFREREDLNVGIVEAINKASEAWGIVCLRYEIRKFLFLIIKIPSIAWTFSLQVTSNCQRESKMPCKCRSKLRERSVLLF